MKRSVLRRDMPPTGDPVQWIDGELARLAAHLRVCRARGESAMAARLADTIDLRLEQRRDITSDPGGSYRS